MCMWCIGSGVEGRDVHMVWRCVCGVDVYMQCGCVHMCGCVHVVWRCVHVVWGVHM